MSVVCMRFKLSTRSLSIVQIDTMEKVKCITKKEENALNIIGCTHCKEKWTERHFTYYNLTDDNEQPKCARCEVELHPGLKPKLSQKEYWCVSCEVKLPLRQFAPLSIKQVIFDQIGMQQRRCQKCQYPICHGIKGKGCIGPSPKSNYPAPSKSFINGEYICLHCRFPHCECGAPRRPQKRNVFALPIWQCGECKKLTTKKRKLPSERPQAKHKAMKVTPLECKPEESEKNTVEENSEESEKKASKENSVMTSKEPELIVALEVQQCIDDKDNKALKHEPKIPMKSNADEMGENKTK